MFSHGAPAPTEESRDEAAAFEKVTALEEERRNLHIEGMDINKVTATQLGVKDNVAATFPDPSQLPQQILDKRVHARLKAWAAEHNHHHEQRKHFMLRPFIGAWHKLWDQVSRLGLSHSHAEHFLHEQFGEKTDIASMKASLRPAILTRLGALPDDVKIQIFQDGFQRIASVLPSNDDLCDAILQANATQLQTIKAIINPATSKGIFDGVDQFKRLTVLRGFEDEEKAKVLHPHLYDKDRLQKVLYDLQTAAKGTEKGNIWELLSSKVLKKDALFQLEGNPPVLALLVDLEYRLNSRTHGTLLQELETMVDKKMPTVMEKTKDGVPEEEQPESLAHKETVKKSGGDFFSVIPEFKKVYAQATVLQTSLTDAINNLADAKAATASATSAATLASRPLTKEQVADFTRKENDAQREKAALKDKQEALYSQIKGFETAILSHASDFINTLDQHGKKIDNKDGSKLLYFLKDTLKTAVLPANTNNLNDLFPTAGGTANPKGILKYILEVADPLYLKDLQKEIKDYSKNLNPRMKVDARQLLLLMRQGDLEARGTTSPEMNLRYANMSVNLSIADAKSANRYASANNAIAMSLLPGLEGTYTKAKEFLASQRFDSGVFTARDFIQYVSGLDHSFAAFAHLEKHSSVAEISAALAHHPVTPEQLQAFISTIDTGLATGEIDGHVVKLKHNEFDIEKLLDNLQRVHTRLVSQATMKQVIHPKEEHAKLSKAETMLRVMEAEAKAEQEFASTLPAKVQEYMKGLWRPTLKEAYGEKAREARAYIKSHKLSGKAKENYIKSQGLETAMKILDSGMAREDAYLKVATGAKAAAKWAGEKAKAGGGRARGAIAEHAGKALGHVASGAGKALGHAATGTGKLAKFALWTAPVAVAKAPFQAVGLAAKAAFWPFKTLWKAFHTTPEDTAALRAKLDKQKAEAAAKRHKKAVHAPAAHGKKDAHAADHGHAAAA